MTTPESGWPLRCATLQWDDDQPTAPAFGDIYHARDGAHETQRVYIEPAAIVDRWRKQSDFTVGELGFGTGLNLVALLERWQQTPGTRLHYISFERYPIACSDWRDLCARRAHPRRTHVRPSYSCTSTV